VVWEILTRHTPYENLESAVAILKYVAVENGRPDMDLIPDDCPPKVKLFFLF
jgi:hypothetical protein